MSLRIRERGTSKIGQVFGVNTVVSLAGYNRHNRAMWTVLCSLCGRTRNIDTCSLSPTRGHGCMCQASARTAALRRTHGLSRSGIYMVWFNIIERCSNPRSKSYANYGGRGISYCPEWSDLMVFHAWAISNGWRRGLEIDRIDNNGNYDPSNCRFVTHKANGNNKRSNTRLSAFGESKTYAEWMDDPRCAVKYTTLVMRISTYGYDPERAISEPPKKYDHVSN
jgi:hypothetical protein